MTAPTVRSCPSCRTPLPSDAEFCPKCGSRTPTHTSAGGTTEVVDPLQGDALAAQRERLQHALGADYVVEHLLGSGGFAQVWAAQDRKLQRRVAVKVLHPELVASRSLIERFQREAQAVAKLRHPGIVPIYGVGEHEGLAYYIMPLIEGISLRQAMQGGPLAAAEARRILRETAAALTVAHKAGIVHRDIKPENIMLDGEERRVLVMDFGIAKSTAATGTGLTGTGMIIGTPAYMSPEQAMASKELTVRSDVYSLGVVAFEMLTGSTPFQADSVPELVMKQVAAAPPSLAAVKPDAPDDLVIAINRCLAKDPGERWQNSGEIAAFLEAQSTPTAAPAPVPRDLKRFARRRWRPSARELIWAATGIVIVATILAVRLSPADVSDAWAMWAGKVGLVRRRPAEPGEAERSAWSRRPTTWALGWSAHVLGMGDSGLAVVADRLYLFDGRSWRERQAPGPIRAATGAGPDILLFSYRDDEPAYRWSASGLVSGDTVPFAVFSAWADSGRAAVVGSMGYWQLAVRDSRGWRRVPSPRRVALTGIGGTAANDLVAIGNFAEAYANGPDSIAEFDGTSWETIDPRPPGTNELWRFHRVGKLADGSLAVAGELGEWTNVRRDSFSGSGEWRHRAPLLLVRSSRSHWRRVPLTPANAPAQTWITDFWGRSPNDMLVWNSWCDSCRLAELRGGAWKDDRTMGPGSLAGIVETGGVIYAVWRDATVWAQRNGRWVFATEVPVPPVVASASVMTGDWSSGMEIRDHVQLGFCNPGCTTDQGVFDSVSLDASRGAAVGRMRGWVLGGDGAVRRIDCAALNRRCAVGREPFVGALALIQRPRRGGALVVGLNGLLVRSNELGVWTRLPVPQVMARESLYSVSEAGDGRIAVLSAQHLAVLDSLGAVLRVKAVSDQDRPAAILMGKAGSVAVVYREHVTVESLVGTELWKRFYRVAAWLALSDGRFVFGQAGDASDPFDRGIIEIASADSSGVRSQFAGIGTLRSRVMALAEERGDLLIRTPSGTYSWPVASVPFAPGGPKTP